MPNLDDFVAVNDLLADLNTLIRRAEAHAEFRVRKATLDLTVVNSRTAGLGTPGLAAFFIPKDLASADLGEVHTQRLTFTLTRSNVVAVAAGLDDALDAALSVIQASLDALRTLTPQFTATATVEFKFELSREGKLSFVVRAGGKSTRAHTLALDVERTLPTP